MQQPYFCSDAVTEEIKLIQTHASWVLLARKYAYKIEKSVNFGFLDYSTLEKRKHFLHEELWLNLLIASKLYLKILPISYSERQFILGNSNNIAEYAWKMRQFPQANLSSNLLKSNKLNSDRCESEGNYFSCCFYGEDGDYFHSTVYFDNIDNTYEAFSIALNQKLNN